MNNKTLARIGLVTAIALIVVVFFAFDLNRFADFEYLRSARGSLQQVYEDQPLIVILLFAAIYVVVAATSLPGATLLTLAAGAMFGFAGGAPLVSICSTLGATLAFLGARFLFRESLEKRFESQLDAVHEGMNGNHALYLFGLRLVPIFPFFVINLVLGVTRIRTWTYIWVSQLGMLPATMVYVNAGTELGRLSSPSDILSPWLIASLSLLGVFPIAANWALKLLRRYAGETQNAD